MGKRRRLERGRIRFMSIYEYTPILIYSIVIAFVFGTCMGSFLNCAAWRYVNGESVLKGRSHCTSCGHELGLRDLIPVISWLASKGRCRYCGERISARYPITEVLFGIITVFCLLSFDFTVLCLRNYIFLAALFVLTLTDIDAMVIPDGCHIASLAAWVAAEPFLFEGWKNLMYYAGAGLLFGGGLLAVSLALDRAMGRDTLGGGDIKLVAVAGLYLGVIGTLFMLMIACLCGLIYNYLINKTSEKGSAFPFGPWIASASAMMLLFGQPLVDLYMALLI